MGMTLNRNRPQSHQRPSILQGDTEVEEMTCHSRNGTSHAAKGHRSSDTEFSALFALCLKSLEEVHTGSSRRPC